MEAAEARFLRMAEPISLRADYLQTGSTGRHSLPDAAVVGAVAYVLTALGQSFLAKLGDKLSEGAIGSASNLLKRRPSTSQACVEALRLLAPYLDVVATATELERTIYLEAIATELRRLGFSEGMARRVSQDVFDAVAQGFPG